jgi:hypothetical protein
VKFLDLGICDVRESGDVLFLQSRRAVVFMNKSFGVLEEAKSKTSLQKSGLECELVAHL